MNKLEQIENIIIQYHNNLKTYDVNRANAQDVAIMEIERILDIKPLGDKED